MKDFGDTNNGWIEILFWCCLLLLLYPIWTNAYYPTGDGPCHLYNSRILLDFIRNSNVDFYSEFYTLNRNTEPNWFSHIALATLLSIFNASFAEKIFLTAYIILFGVGLKKVLQHFHKHNAFIALIGMSFVTHSMLYKGFFNYSFGIGFSLLAIWFWLKNQNRFSILQFVFFTAINTLTYFTHPVAFLFSGLVIFSLETSKWILHLRQSSTGWNLSQNSFKARFSFLPGSLLLLNYIQQKGLNPTPSTSSAKYLYHQFIELTSLVSLHEREEVVAISLSVIIGCLTLLGIFLKFKKPEFHIMDGALVAFIISVVVYFNAPSGIAGGGILVQRIQFLPYLLILIWLSQFNFMHNIRIGFGLVGVLLLMGFSFYRIPIHKLASNAVEEYVSVQDKIEPNSTVLPLSYSHKGKTPEGNVVSNKMWLFLHAFDYVGADKPLILLANYEATVGYFPFRWKPDINPFIHLGKNEGLEHLPPSIRVSNYESVTGQKVDYIVLWCLDEDFENHKYTIDIYQQLSSNFKLVKTSKNGLSQLYQRL